MGYEINIEFRKIDKSNYEECVDLVVHDEQKSFVAPNWWSLLQGIYEENKYPLAIYDEDTMIGFLMYSFEKASEEYPVDSWWFERFMIDKKFQRKGYGEGSLEKFLDFIKNELGNIELRTSVEPDNEVVIKLYEKFDFIKTGEIVCDEVVLLRKI